MQPAAQLGFGVVAIVVGLVLLTAAGLKIHGLIIDPLSQDSFLASSRLQIATIEIEVLLGLWLLSGWARRAASITALAFFGILATVSLYLAFTGQRSCGCLGRVPVNPVFTFSLDIVVFLAFLWLHPPQDGNLSETSFLASLVRTAAGTTVFLVLIGGTFLLVARDPATALARLRGELFAVEPALSDLGDGTAGENRTFTGRVHNRSGQSVRVLGATSPCFCFVTDDLPLVIQPGQVQALRVRARLTGNEGRFQHQFFLRTDNEQQPSISARFGGRILLPTE